MQDYNILIGEKFGRLTIVEFIERKNLHTWYKCVCTCGGSTTTTLNNLRRGSTQSCGCLQRERASKSNTRHGYANRTPEYRTWKTMKDRCYNNKNKRFYDWGGRGIKVCERWLNSFTNFLEDMGYRPSKEHSLDRFPDIDGDYGPNNCRWATRFEQGRGKRNNVWLEYENKKMILSDWAKYFGVSIETLRDHLAKKTFTETYFFYMNKNKNLEL